MGQTRRHEAEKTMTIDIRRILAPGRNFEPDRLTRSTVIELVSAPSQTGLGTDRLSLRFRLGHLSHRGFG
jgi:hypothetical protein